MSEGRLPALQMDVWLRDREKHCLKPSSTQGWAAKTTPTEEKLPRTSFGCCSLWQVTWSRQGLIWEVFDLMYRVINWVSRGGTSSFTWKNSESLREIQWNWKLRSQFKVRTFPVQSQSLAKSHLHPMENQQNSTLPLLYTPFRLFLFL